MNRKRALISACAASALVGLLVACSSTPDQKEVAKDATVSLALKDASGNKIGNCAGVLISPGVVLTAGHCVAVSGVSSWDVVLQDGSQRSRGTSGVTYDWQAYQSQLSHPTRHDVGVIYLNQTIDLPHYPNLDAGTSTGAASRSGVEDGSLKVADGSLAKESGFPLYRVLGSGEVSVTGGPAFSQNGIVGVTHGYGPATGNLYVARLTGLSKFLGEKQECNAGAPGGATADTSGSAIRSSGLNILCLGSGSKSGSCSKGGSKGGSSSGSTTSSSGNASSSGSPSNSSSSGSPSNSSGNPSNSSGNPGSGSPGNPGNGSPGNPGNGSPGNPGSSGSPSNTGSPGTAGNPGSSGSPSNTGSPGSPGGSPGSPSDNGGNNPGCNNPGTDSGGCFGSSCGTTGSNGTPTSSSSSGSTTTTSGNPNTSSGNPNTSSGNPNTSSSSGNTTSSSGSTTTTSSGSTDNTSGGSYEGGDECQGEDKVLCPSDIFECASHAGAGELAKCGGCGATPVESSSVGVGSPTGSNTSSSGSSGLVVKSGGGVLGFCRDQIIHYGDWLSKGTSGLSGAGVIK